jgi:sec-independent protein translocase protein TatB
MTMFEIGWAELLVIGVVALIVIGPEDLPQMFRQVGRFTGKLRQMGREFSRAMDQAAKETGVKDVAKDLGNITSPKSMGLDAVKAAADKFEKWDPIKNAAKPAPVKRAATAGEAAADSADAALEARTSAAVASMTPPPAAPAPVGPATQALYDKQAARKKVLDESAAKLKALDTAEPTPKPKRAPRAAKSAVAEPAPTAKPKAPRAKKAADPVEIATKKPRAPRKPKAIDA